MVKIKGYGLVLPVRTGLCIVTKKEVMVRATSITVVEMILPMAGVVS
ncbi:hypothetical protein CCP3SC1AL1_3110001 [Gammaproteobacteria bacterium]